VNNYKLRTKTAALVVAPLVATQGNFSCFVEDVLTPKHISLELVPGYCMGLIAAFVSGFTSTVTLAQQLMPTSLPDVQVFGQAPIETAGPAGSGFSFSTKLDARTLQKPGDLLIEAGLAGWDVSGGMGLATTVQSRGFSANPQSSTGLSTGKILLNGHPDVGRRFVRDPVTIERISYLGMTDATQAASSTPAGTVLFQSKMPTGQPHLIYGLAGASNGLARWTLDTERELGALQMRIVAAQQVGDKTVDGVIDAHNTVLLSSRIASSAMSSVRLDIESQSTHLPFPFGTVYEGNQFWYDRAYVSSTESQATRRNDRAAAYWDAALDDQTKLTAHAQRATGKRNEDLLGFWTILSTGTLSSYARHIDEQYQQTDWGVAAEHAFAFGNQTHHTRLSYADSLQSLDFSGPQNIGAFSIDVAEPQFNVPFSSISLAPRLLKERYSEKTWAVSDRLVFSPRWELHTALTHNIVDIESSATGAPMATSAAHGLTNFAMTASYKPIDTTRMWMGWSNAFEPNRGTMKSGEFLPPKQAQESELGFEFKQGTQKFQISLYDIRQSNLAGRDPSDRNYLIPVGAARSSGVQFTGRRNLENLALYAGATLQHARATMVTSAAQGTYLPGMADRYGAVGGTWQPRMSSSPEVDLKMIATGTRPGDSMGTFFAPGASVWHLNVFGKSASIAGAQWSIGLFNVFDKRYIRALSAPDYAWQGERRKLALTWQQAL
jgi:outer membrane receptor protein involved in Fe transport